METLTHENKQPKAPKTLNHENKKPKPPKTLNHEYRSPKSPKTLNHEDKNPKPNMKTKQHQQKQAFIIQSLIDRSRISSSNDGLLFSCNSSFLQQTLLFSGKTSMFHTHNAWTCTQWPHSIAPAFFIANLQLTPPMTSKHTPKTKRTHGKQKFATNKRKKERKKEKKRKSNIFICCQQPSTCSFPLEAYYFRLEAIFNLSKQCRLGISQIEHLQIWTSIFRFQGPSQQFQRLSSLGSHKSWLCSCKKTHICKWTSQVHDTESIKRRRRRRRRRRDEALVHCKHLADMSSRV